MTQVGTLCIVLYEEQRGQEGAPGEGPTYVSPPSMDSHSQTEVPTPSPKPDKTEAHTQTKDKVMEVGPLY